MAASLFLNKGHMFLTCRDSRLFVIISNKYLRGFGPQKTGYRNKMITWNAFMSPFCKLPLSLCSRWLLRDGDGAKKWNIQLIKIPKWLFHKVVCIIFLCLKTKRMRKRLKLSLSWQGPLFLCHTQRTVGPRRINPWCCCRAASAEQQGIKNSNLQLFGHKFASVNNLSHTFCCFLCDTHQTLL